jgi:hypothetical protein
MDTEPTRRLATQVAPLLPGEWRAEWEDHTVGAYLVSGDMRLFLSAQTGYGHKPGMVRISPHLPSGPAWEDPDNKSDAIYVGEGRSPEAFAKKITRRIFEAQDYPAKVARQVGAHATYQAAADTTTAFAGELSAILGAELREGTSTIYAYPHGDWQMSSDSARLDVYLPRDVAIKVARMLMEEM